ncbi:MULTISPECIES: DUF1376 domain-containing protein [unclassified Mesorhizobium]|uniref:DUF1376 domain-containing protein n=1 Tax=unclassified Mesorhizobium TaxID=325217 RepID=UPI00333D907A
MSDKLKPADWLRFNVKEFMTMRRRLTPVEVAALMDIICEVHIREAPWPEDVGRLAKSCQTTTPAMRKAIETLVSENLVIRTPGGLWSDFSGDEIAYRKSRSEVNAGNAYKRWGKTEQNQRSKNANAYKSRRAQEVEEGEAPKRGPHPEVPPPSSTPDVVATSPLSTGGESEEKRLRASSDSSGRATQEHNYQLPSEAIQENGDEGDSWLSTPMPGEPGYIGFPYDAEDNQLAYVGANVDYPDGGGECIMTALHPEQRRITLTTVATGETWQVGVPEFVVFLDAPPRKPIENENDDEGDHDNVGDVDESEPDDEIPLDLDPHGDGRPAADPRNRT